MFKFKLPFDKHIRKVFTTEKQMYFLYGILFGLNFPIFATLLQCYLDGMGYGFNALIYAQSEHELLWIIDSAPLFLGVFAAFGGEQMDKIYSKNKELIHRYQQLLLLRDAADAANRAKSDFLANMSHEIRTPMNAIMGMNYLLDKSDLNPKQKDYTEKIDSSAKSLLRIIDDILDFSKIEAGKLSLENTDMVLEEVVIGVVDTANVKLKKKSNVELVTQLDNRLPQFVIGDALRLRQVLLNLVDNAIKFTSEGEIILSVKLHTDLPYGVIVEFSVKDTGIGMDQEQVNKLFRPFQQADISTTRKYGGTGLGLTISKRIVEMMDGELTVASEKDKGTEFKFYAFFSKSSQIELNSSYINSLHGLNALLVDDSQSARDVLKDMLESFGFSVFVATSGESALEMYHSLKNQSIEISLMVVDWRMPGMNGLDLVRRLNGEEGIKTPSVLMVTAYGVDYLKTATKEQLVEGYLVKPIQPSILFDTINGILYNAARKKGALKVQKMDVDLFRKELSGTRVLLVEDNDINKELAMELLEDVGMSVVTAENGLEAINLLNVMSFDVVLMDIQMPEMDGLTATREIRKIESFKDLPILAMTAHALKGEKEKSLEAGMNDHITKPIHPENLYTSLVSHLKHKDLKSASESRSGDDSSLIFDYEMALLRVSGKEEVLSKLLQRFVSRYADINVRLKDILLREGKEEVRMYLHEIQGVSGNLGLNSLSVATSEFGSFVKESKELDHQDCLPYIDRLTAAYRDASRVIQEKISEDQVKVHTEVEAFDMNEFLIILEEKCKGFDQEALSLVNEAEEQLSNTSYFQNFQKIVGYLEEYEFDSALLEIEKIRNQ